VWHPHGVGEDGFTPPPPPAPLPGDPIDVYDVIMTSRGGVMGESRRNMWGGAGGIPPPPPVSPRAVPGNQNAPLGLCARARGGGGGVNRLVLIFTVSKRWAACQLWVFCKARRVLLAQNYYDVTSVQLNFFIAYDL
jgi:hypothetical protein